MSTDKTLRVAMYARFSSDNQRSESIDAQIRAKKKYYVNRHFWCRGYYVDTV